MGPLLRRVSKAVLDAPRLILTWIFLGDVAYAVLPIFVLALINGLVKASFEDFLLIKEWAFATIILFGVSIRGLIRLKLEIQDTPKSYRLNLGVQLYVILLIAAVLVLSLLILVEKGFLPRDGIYELELAQFTLFLMALASTFILVWAEDLQRRNESTLPDGIPLGWLLHRVIRAACRAGDDLDYAVYAMKRAQLPGFCVPPDATATRREGDKQIAALRAQIERLSTLLNSLREHTDTFKTA